MTISVTPIPRLIDLAAPSFTLGTANAAGSAVTAVASDATLLAFDGVAVDAITLGQSGSVGSATVAPRRDHAHAMESVTAASQAEMEAASSTTVFATPGRTQYHPGVAKAHIQIPADGVITPSAADSFNVSSVTDTSAGVRSIYWDTDFSNTTYSCVGSVMSSNLYARLQFDLPAVGSIRMFINRVPENTEIDEVTGLAAFGDQ